MNTKSIGVVLAHGAWMDGSSWSKVITLLNKAGIRSVAAALPMTAFAEDVKAVESALARLGGDAILVGHAYAGAVVAAVQSKNVKGLGFVAALTPDEGQTLAEVYGMGDRDPRAPQLAPDANGMMFLPEAAFADAFAQHATAEEQAMLAAVQRPIAPGCIMVPMARPSWKDLPSWFMIAEQDRMIPRATQELLAKRMGAKVTSLAVDHVPNVTAAQAVADMILDAVRALGA